MDEYFFFMVHRQLWSFSMHIFVLKNNKSGISKLKKFEYFNGNKRVLLTRIISDLTIQKQTLLSDKVIPINFKVLNYKLKIVIKSFLQNVE